VPRVPKVLKVPRNPDSRWILTFLVPLLGGVRGGFQRERIKDKSYKTKGRRQSEKPPLGVPIAMGWGWQVTEKEVV